MSSENERTQFDYLLNAFERASQSDKPAENGYRDKRLALFAHVRDLERKASGALAQRSDGVTVPPLTDTERLDRLEAADDATQDRILREALAGKTLRNAIDGVLGTGGSDGGGAPDGGRNP